MTVDQNSSFRDAEIWQKSLIDAALDAVIVIDAAGLIVDFNPSAETTFGYKKQAVLGMRMSDLIIPPTLRQAHCDGLARLKRTRAPKILGQRLELPAVRSDGSEFPVELIVVEVPVVPPLYVGYVRDISDRKQAEEALRASVKRFQALADSAPLMIWLVNREGGGEWFNRSWLEFSGRELDQLVGSAWVDLLHPDDVPPFFDAYNRLVETGQAFSMEFRLQHADGSFHWVLGNVAATLGPDQSRSGFAGSCVDISSRRRAEKALRLTQYAVDGAADSIFWVRPDASLQYVNDQACRALGYSRIQLLAMKLTDFVADVPFDAWSEQWKRIRSEGHVTFETLHQRKDGTVFPVEILANHICFLDEEFICVFVRDISERQEAQASLANAMQEAQAANRAKSEFLAIVSHEMRTPLNSILGTIDLALQDDISEEQSEMIAICRRSGIQLKELINDMLDYSQIQAGKFSLQSGAIDMGYLLDRIRNLYDHRVQDKELEFRWQVSRAIPSALVGDERRLSQVIENLLSNAVKFTDAGYVAFHADLHLSTEDEVVLRFEVEDSGIGIAPELRERIFLRFEQVDSGPTRAFGGVGLGLTICRQLVELMNGQIHCEEGDEGGARFVFTARFSRFVDPSEEPALRKSARESRGKHGLSGVRVLLAEDDPASQLVAERMLQREGVEVVLAEDGAAAVEMFAKDPDGFDAILMDVMMPRLDGIEATKRIRGLENRHVPVVALTAQAMMGDRERILRSQVDAYVAKPVDRHLLITTLSELVSVTRTRQAPDQTNPVHALKLVDVDALRERCDHDDELFAEVVLVFDKMCEHSLRDLTLGLKRSDEGLVISVTHRLKGAIANMCARLVFERCQAMESNARASNLAFVQTQLPAFEAELTALRAELKTL